MLTNPNLYTDRFMTFRSTGLRILTETRNIDGVLSNGCTSLMLERSQKKFGMMSKYAIPRPNNGHNRDIRLFVKRFGGFCVKKKQLLFLLFAGVFTLVSTVFASHVEADTSIYRLYHPGLRVHLYTKDNNEYKVLGSRGWKQEGVAWTADDKQGDVVYRLYNSGLRVHLYTKDTNEYKVLGTRGWRQEGAAYRSYGETPIYRLYHQGLKKHLYTKDSNEYKVLGTRGWRQEGVAFYGLSKTPVEAPNPFLVVATSIGADGKNIQVTNSQVSLGFGAALSKGEVLNGIKQVPGYHLKSVRLEAGKMENGSFKKAIDVTQHVGNMKTTLRYDDLASIYKQYQKYQFAAFQWVFIWEKDTPVKQPVTTTKAPATTTKAPVTTTKAPVTTTKVPELFMVGATNIGTDGEIIQGAATTPGIFAGAAPMGKGAVYNRTGVIPGYHLKSARLEAAKDGFGEAGFKKEMDVTHLVKNIQTTLSYDQLASIYQKYQFAAFEWVFIWEKDTPTKTPVTTAVKTPVTTSSKAPTTTAVKPPVKTPTTTSSQPAVEVPKDFGIFASNLGIDWNFSSVPNGYFGGATFFIKGNTMTRGNKIPGYHLKAVRLEAGHIDNGAFKKTMDVTQHVGKMKTTLSYDDLVPIYKQYQKYNFDAFNWVFEWEKDAPVKQPITTTIETPDTFALAMVSEGTDGKPLYGTGFGGGTLIGKGGVYSIGKASGYHLKSVKLQIGTDAVGPKGFTMKADVTHLIDSTKNTLSYDQLASIYQQYKLDSFSWIAVWEKD